MKKYLFLLSLVALVFALSSLSFKRAGEEVTAGVTISDINFKEYTLPNTLPPGNKISDLGNFAWASMLALNWQATYDGVHITKRGEAVDGKDWNYSHKSIPNYVVWETFAHRTELRPAHKKASNFDRIIKSSASQGTAFDNPPNYTFGKPGKPIKITPEENIGPSTKGALKTTYAQTNLLNCLDEDNEIGSCLLFAKANPKDDQDVSTLTNQVLYQAKINRVGFEYKKNHFNGGYNDKGNKETSVGRAAKKGALPPIVNNPNMTPEQIRAAYEKANSAKLQNIAKCDDDKSGAVGSITAAGNICFPCAGATYNGVESDGIIEIKTAWRRYHPKKEPHLDPNDFLMRKAIYFTKKSETEYIAHNGLFLLIGMHIIRKTEHYPTYVIATFEHESVTTDGYNYVSKPGGDGDYEELYGVKPVKRIHSYVGDYAEINKSVHTLLKAKNPKHYLNHYQLAGVQGEFSTGYTTTDATNEGKDGLKNSFYLANYVIESDVALGNFYGSFGLPQKGNQGGFFNTVTPAGKVITTGGCKGCHGVAQTGGKDMSFLMDNSKPADHPDEGLLSQSTLKTDYLGPTLLLEAKPNAKRHIPSTTFLSADLGGGLRGRVSTFTVKPGGVQYQGIGVNPYNQTYPKNSLAPNNPIDTTNFKDLDNRPAKNLTFVDYDATKGTAKIHLRDIADGYIAKATSKDEVNFYVSTDKSDGITFKINILERGYITLESTDGKPVTIKNYPKKGNLKYVLGFGKKGSTKNIAKFQVNGFTESELNAIK